MPQMTKEARENPEISRPAAVYRLYDAGGTLLYVGSAYDPEHRCKSHHKKPWWPQVARRVDEWHKGRDGAFAAEARAIAAELPRRNITGTPNHTGPKERGRALREAAAARWRVARAAEKAGASREDACRAGGYAEIEYLEATGMFRRYTARMRREMEQKGGTYASRAMSLA